jgi:predicted KAP-like P-loop ATPase
MISPDAPIQSAKDDLLGRAGFAAGLAKAIAGVSGSDSFVVAIHGRWGTGKSSVLNLIVEQIHVLNGSTESDDEKLYLMRFNPWNFADQNQLVFQFLKQFRAHLLKFETTAKKDVQRIVDTLDDYAEALAPPLELIPHGKLLSGSLKFGLRGARKLLGSAKEIGDIFCQLSTQSAALKRRTVVLIDDIDRLSAAETRQIFQLVKLTARFPYIVYVLAFDRSAVADALKEVGVDSGEEYLEKIVQVSFDLPAISEATLTSFITEGIDSLLQKYKPAHFDTHRFGNLFHGGFRHAFSSVRQVRRFLNGLEFILSLIGKEVNGVDIVGVEALRTFHPRAFAVVRNHRDLFAGHIDAVTEQLAVATRRNVSPI